MAAVSTFPSAAAATNRTAVHHPQQVWRPAERAREIAEEFCGDGASSWKTLPPRLERLGRRLQAWVSAASSVRKKSSNMEAHVFRDSVLRVDSSNAIMIAWQVFFVFRCF